MAANTNLHKAKEAKNDEFYTQLSDVEKELVHYKEHFKDKVVFCNCDDPTWSAFWRYFHINFAKLGLKKLVSTHYNKDIPTTNKLLLTEIEEKAFTYKMEYIGGDDANIEAGVKTTLKGNGDFRSSECIKILDECDIVVTNPPFSLAREYIACMVEHKKRFLIVGDLNWITYKEVFPMLKDNEIWLGNCAIKEFIQPDGTVKKFGNKLWFTNLDHKKRHEKLILWKDYTPEEYPDFDNYAGINVNRVTDIPCDYNGIMGVPITYLDKHNPEQFEILGITCRGYSPEYRTKLYDAEHYEKANDLNGSGCILVDGKPTMLYGRVLIRKK